MTESTAAVIPADQDRGEFRITDQMMWEAGAATMAAFEVLVREEARRRNLALSVEEESFTGTLIVRWRPDRSAGEGV